MNADVLLECNVCHQQSLFATAEAARIAEGRGCHCGGDLRTKEPIVTITSSKAVELLIARRLVHRTTLQAERARKRVMQYPHDLSVQSEWRAALVRREMAELEWQKLDGIVRTSDALLEQMPELGGA